MELRAMPWHESVIGAELAKTKVLVNASNVGAVPDETPIPGELIPPDLLVLDLIYSIPQTRLLREAAAAGSETMNGELMLLHQSAAAFTLWTGQPAPLQLMQERLDEARPRKAPAKATDGAGEARGADEPDEATSRADDVGGADSDVEEVDDRGAAEGAPTEVSSLA
jgi:hypothetical protein